MDKIRTQFFFHYKLFPEAWGLELKVFPAILPKSKFQRQIFMVYIHNLTTVTFKIMSVLG